MSSILILSIGQQTMLIVKLTPGAKVTHLNTGSPVHYFESISCYVCQSTVLNKFEFSRLKFHDDIHFAFYWGFKLTILAIFADESVQKNEVHQGQNFTILSHITNITTFKPE